MGELCTDWTTAEEVSDCCPGWTEGTDTAELEPHVELASAILHLLTGGRFGGECGPVTVRPPCPGSCGCWGSGAYGWNWDWHLGAWRSAGRAVGCSPISEIRLAGLPVREITEVKIDGDVVDPSEYRLDPPNRLVRMRDAADPNRRLVWPGCQIMDLDDTEDGTFSVTYTYGEDPPVGASAAAAALACQLWSACGPEADCALPEGTTRIVREGISIEIASAIAPMLAAGATGILALDAFLAVHGSQQPRSSVWSPDRPWPRRVDSAGT